MTNTARILSYYRSADPSGGMDIIIEELVSGRKIELFQSDWEFDQWLDNWRKNGEPEIVYYNRVNNFLGTTDMSVIP